MINILWTGGFDSTFRIVQLSKLPITVQPYYIINEHRRSVSKELAAIKKISEIIRCKESTRFSLLPVVTRNVNSIEIPVEIKEAYESVRKIDYLGNQYIYLSAFSREVDCLELSVHKDDRTTIFGRYQEIEDEITGNSFIIDKQRVLPEVYLLLKNFRFPINQWTKKDMKLYYEQENAKDIMNKTWFCHSPVLGMPCGVCNPCRYTIEEGLSYRIPKMMWLYGKIMSCFQS